MAEGQTRAEAAVVVSFLQRYARDLADGQVLPLTDYQARYRGFELVVAREYRCLAKEGADGETLVESAGATDSQVSIAEADSEVLAGLGRERGHRYRQPVEIGRGGTGIVKRVWDPDIRRKVAMKLLHGGTTAGSGDAPSRPSLQALSRFLEEAQITGQLEHPGIVPVHELGVDSHGRAYFTMSLVRGRNLKEIIELVYRGEEGWSRTRALGVIQRVCEAVAFAHSKGVVHRDLKPSNVMVGRFGETYVMDWGLARVLDDDDRKDIRLRMDATETLSAVQSLRRDMVEDTPDSPLVTMDGDVVGTPAYMAPEQARGQVDQVGPRADVYAIGAMLYHLLTGQVPFVPRDARLSSRSVLARVVEGPPRPVRKVAPEVPAELGAICEKAMAREPEARYAGVLELAEDLRAYLETRVVRAYATGARAELKKWVLRNKGLSVASAAAVLALALGLVFSLVEKARADEQTARAESNFTLAFDAVDRMLTKVGDETLADVPQMDAVRKELLRDALELNQRVLESRRDDPTVRAEVAKAHQRVAAIHWKLGELDEAEQAQREAVAAFEAVVRDNPDQPKLRAEMVWASNAVATYVLGRGRPAEGQAILEQVLVGLDEVLRIFPDDPAYRGRKAVVFSNLAVALHRQGRNEAALDCAEQALAIRESLAREHEDNPVFRYGAATQCINVGYMYERLRRYVDAVAVYEKGVRGMRALLALDPGDRAYREDLGKLLNNLGIVQRRGESADNAIAAETLREAIVVNRRLLEDFRGVPAYHKSLGGSLSNLGQALRGQRDLEGARRCFEEAVDETRIAYDAVPEDPEVRTYLTNQYPKLLSVLGALQQHRELARRCEEYATLDFLENAWKRAGSYLALCAGLAQKDPALTPEVSAELAARYGDRAMEMLQQALDAGLSDAEALKHRNYDALRGREDFAKLCETVAAKASGQGKD